MKSSIVKRVRRSLKGVLTDNLRLKLLAGLITVLVFFLVRGGREASARVDVSIDVAPPPATASRVLMTPISELPDTVTLRVRGSPGVIQQLDDDEIPRVELDVSEEHDGAFMISPDLFRLPPGVEVESIQPASIDLVFEERVERQVQVHPLIGGRVVDGFHVKEPIGVEPSVVTVSGPRSVIREIQEVQTKLINVEGLGEGVHLRQPLLKVASSHVNYVGVDQVSVTIIVEPNIIERAFSEVAVEVRGTSLSASAETVSITIRGQGELVGRVDEEALVVFVELGEDGDTPGTYRRDVQFEGIDESLQAESSPSTVIVQLTEPRERQGSTDGATTETEDASTVRRDGGGPRSGP